MAAVKQKHNRFKDAEWFGQFRTILIGGVGGTGSWFSILVSRTGDHELHVYDDDIYEEHNMAGQFVNSNQISETKVSALKQNLDSFSMFKKVHIYNEKYTEESPANEIMVSCFDNMKARRDMFTNWKNSIEGNGSEHLFIDMRLLAESLTIFFVQGDKPEQIAEYESEHLPDDSAVPDADCTLKQTSHAAALIASLAVGFFTNWLANKKEGFDYRNVPFRYDYMIALNLTENVYL